MPLPPCKIEIERKRGAWRLAAEGHAAILVIVVGAVVLFAAAVVGLPAVGALFQ